MNVIVFYKFIFIKSFGLNFFKLFPNIFLNYL